MFSTLALAGLLAVAPARPDAVAALRTLTEQRFAANARSDRAFYERLLAPHFMLMLPGHAAQTKPEYLATEFGARPPGFRGAPARITDFKAAVQGDSAVATYAAVEPTDLGGQAFESR